ncbi:MAG: hypothetical protein ACTSR3_15940 [Candidatus Helarchaeota archaeon]
MSKEEEKSSNEIYPFRTSRNIKKNETEKTEKPPFGKRVPPSYGVYKKK